MNDLLVPPWYRQFWPWALMAGPAAVIVAGAVTLWLALRTPEALVVDDYYKQGKAIHLLMQRDQTARDWGLQAQWQRQADRIQVKMTASRDYAWPEQLELQLLHPVDARQDQRLLLMRTTHSAQQAEYFGRLAAPLATTRYDLTLQDRAGQWRLLL